MQRKFTTWHILKGLVLIVAVFMFVAVAQAEQKRDFYKVGVVTALSGAYVYGGSVTKRGYELWAQQVNKQGGIKVNGERYKVKLIYADTQSKPRSAAAAAQRMILRKDVDFILGPYSSAATLAVAPITERYKVPMITGSAESPRIWQEHFDYTFGTIPAINRTGAAVIKVLAKQHPEIDTISILGMNDPFSKATAKAFRTGAKKAGLEVLSFNITPPRADLTPLISKVQSLDPDVFAVAGEPKAAIKVVKTMQSLDYYPKGLVVHYGINTPDFQKAVGGTGPANYVLGVTLWTPEKPTKDDLFGTSKHYAKLSRQRYGVTPDYGQAGSSATGEVFAAALQKAGLAPPLSDAEQVKLKNALEEVRVMTFFGPIAFAPKGPWYHDNIALEPLVIQMVDGEMVLVGPADIAEHHIVYPRPAAE